MMYGLGNRGDLANPDAYRETEFLIGMINSLISG